MKILFRVDTAYRIFVFLKKLSILYGPNWLGWIRFERLNSPYDTRLHIYMVHAKTGLIYKNGFEGLGGFDVNQSIARMRSIYMFQTFDLIIKSYIKRTKPA